MKFNELSLSEQLQSSLTLNGFETATEVQETTIPIILEGKDIVVRSQTGSGKTFAFGLPIIEKIDFDVKTTQALIVCPTRELAVQVTEELRKITRTIEGIKIVPVYGGSDITKQIMALKTNAKIVVGTPGRIMDHIDRKTLKLNALKFLVLDEADEMLNMGFKDDIEKILSFTNSERQTLMFSATFPPSILAITKNYQKDAVKIQIGEDKKSLDSIKQSYVFVGKEQKTQALIALYKKFNPKLSIIFCNTKRMTEMLVEKFALVGITAVALNGDMRQGSRKKTLESIKKGSENILIATDVAARGIDITDVEYIFNYDLPNNVEYYLHRIGRTARAGKEGNSIAILNTKAQVNILKEYEKETGSEISLYTMGAEFDAANSSSSTRRSSSFERKDRSSNPYEKKESRSFRTDGRSSSSSFSRKREDSQEKKKDYYGSAEKKFSETDRRKTVSLDKVENPAENLRNIVQKSESNFDNTDSKTKKPYASRDRKPFGDKPYASRERKPFGDKPYASRDRKPFDSDKTEGDGEKKCFSSDKPSASRDRKPFGDKPYASRDRKPFGDKPYASRERKPFDSDKTDGDGEKKSFSSDKPYASHDRKPFGDKPYASRDRKPFGDKPYASRDRKPFGDKPYASRERKPFDSDKTEGDGEKKSFSSDKPYASRDRKPFGDKPYASRDRKPFGSDKSFGEKKSFAPKTEGVATAGVKKAYSPRPKSDAGFHGEKFSGGSRAPKRSK